MTDPVFVSTTNMGRSFSLFEILMQYQEAGFMAVELGSGHLSLTGLTDYLKKFPFEYAVHNYFPLDDPNHLIDIASQEPSKLSRTVEIAQRAIDICSDLGGSFYGIHAGYRSNLKAQSLGAKLSHTNVVNYDRAFHTMIDTVQRLCDYALPLGVEIVVENHVLAPFNLVDGKNELLLLCTAEEITEFSLAIKRSNFGILIDVGHLNVTSKTLEFDRYEFIERVSPWIKLFHLSENDRSKDSSRPFDNNAWFAPVIRDHANIHCVVETKAEDIDTLKRQVELVAQWQS